MRSLLPWDLRWVHVWLVVAGVRVLDPSSVRSGGRDDCVEVTDVTPC